MVNNGRGKSNRQGIDGLCVTKTNSWKTDVKVWRECGRMSEHFLVEALLKLVGRWRSAGRMEGAKNVLKVSGLNNRAKERAYQESLRG